MFEMVVLPFVYQNLALTRYAQELFVRIVSNNNKHAKVDMEYMLMFQCASQTRRLIVKNAEVRAWCLYKQWSPLKEIGV